MPNDDIRGLPPCRRARGDHRGRRRALVGFRARCVPRPDHAQLASRVFGNREVVRSGRVVAASRAIHSALRPARARREAWGRSYRRSLARRRRMPQPYPVRESDSVSAAQPPGCSVAQFARRDHASRLGAAAPAHAARARRGRPFARVGFRVHCGVLALIARSVHPRSRRARSSGAEARTIRPRLRHLAQ